jgi:precorrin-3B methylase
MNLQTWKHGIVAKLTLVLLSSLTISLFNCRDDRTTDAVQGAVDILKAIVGVD